MSSDELASILSAIAEVRAETKAGLAGIAQRLEGIEARLDAVERRLDAVERRLDAVERRLDAVETRQQRQGEWQTQIRVDLMERMDRIQNDVRLLRDDISVGLAASERSERIAHGASAEVRLMAEQLSVMRRQIHNLQTEVRALRGEG
jgi:DNA repair ATPase RecN